MKKIIPLFLFIVIGIFLFLSLNSNPNKLPSPLIGKAFPVLEGKDFYTNKNVKLNDLMGDRFTLVNVWASWCVTCRKELEMRSVLGIHCPLPFQRRQPSPRRKHRSLLRSKLGEALRILSHNNFQLG